MTDTPEFAPRTDDEVRDMVRTLTNYDDAGDELPEAALDNHLRVAKMALYNEVGKLPRPKGGGERSFYADSGLAQALVGATAIYAKAAVENYSVAGWSVGDMNIRAGAFDNPENAQFMFWGQLHADGLRASDATPVHAPENTANYIGGYGHQDGHTGDK